MSGNHPFMSVNDVARHFGISRAAAYRAVEAGQIPSVKLGGTLRIARAWVEQKDREALGLPAGGEKQA
jgi:excisionase family DNA binding protein